MNTVKNQKITISNPRGTRPAAGPVAASRPAAPTIRVLLADDHPVVRRGLLSCLANQPGIEVVGEARDGQEALRMAMELNPQVMLMDIGMPRINGLEVTEHLRRDRPSIRVLILSSYTTPEYILRIIRSGAAGYLLKDASTDEMIQGIQAVSQGQVYFSSRVAHLALNQFVRRTTHEGTDSRELSNREREIITHIAEGLSNKEIACRLNIGTRTVETHRERLMRKLGIHSIAGLTRFAIINGFVPFPELSAA